MILQLDPQIPVWVKSKGNGRAIGWVDYSCEDHLFWIIAFDETGEVWMVSNPDVRLQKNISMGRAVNGDM